MDKDVLTKRRSDGDEGPEEEYDWSGAGVRKEDQMPACTVQAWELAARIDHGPARVW